MRFSIRRGVGAVLIASLPIIVALAMPSVSSARPFFWTDHTKTKLLRDITSGPFKFQPAALEFTNEGPIVFEYPATPTGTGPKVFCNEVEAGTTVLHNSPVPPGVKEEEESTLALPFGVAEGDNCVRVPETTEEEGGFAGTNFDVLGTGNVGAEGKAATITVGGVGPAFPAIIHHVRISQHIFKHKWCTWNLNGVPGVFENPAEPFVPKEEEPPNLTLTIPTVVVPIECITEPEKPTEKPKKEITRGSFKGRFFLETPSTVTDTAFVG